MKNLIFTCTILCFSLLGNATHLICGDITYKRIQTFADNSVQYEIKLILVRDSEQSDVNFDDLVNLGIYDKKSLKLVDSLVVRNPARFNYNQSLCVDELEENSFEAGTYTTLKTLPENTNGYYITWERCCKSYFTNIMDENGQPIEPFYLIADIPNTNIENSSSSVPYLLQSFCASTNNKWSLALFDADGDSLLIRLAPIIKGRAAPTQGWALPPINKVFTPKNTTQFQNGFSYTTPMGNGISIGIKNNEIEFNTTSAGLYNVGLEVKEFRNGTLISAHTIDMAALIFTCKNQGTDKPGGLTVEKFAAMKALVSWNTCNQKVDHFEIWRSDISNTNFTMMDTVSALTNRYLDSSLTKSGRYYYKVKGVAKTGQQSGETDTQYIDMFKLGVQKMQWSPTIKVYPNPFQEVINFESDTPIEAIYIQNSVGQIVFQSSPNERIVSIQPKLEKGLYFVTLIAEGSAVTKTVIRLE